MTSPAVPKPHRARKRDRGDKGARTERIPTDNESSPGQESKTAAHNRNGAFASLVSRSTTAAKLTYSKQPPLLKE